MYPGEVYDNETIGPHSRSWLMAGHSMAPGHSLDIINSQQCDIFMTSLYLYHPSGHAEKSMLHHIYFEPIDCMFSMCVSLEKHTIPRMTPVSQAILILF